MAKERLVQRLLRCLSVLFVLTLILSVGYAEAAKPRATPTPTPTLAGTPTPTPTTGPTPTAGPQATCAPTWSPSKSYSSKGSTGADVVSRGCGLGATAWVNYTCYSGNTGQDPCLTHNLDHTGNPWLQPVGCGVIPTPSGEGPGVVITADQHDTVLPFSTYVGGGNLVQRNSNYQYNTLVTAGQAVADNQGIHSFAANGDIGKDIREMAAFTANMFHETEGGTKVVEDGTPCTYSTTNVESACLPDGAQCYYGRGPLQLSWNYNYCHASQAIYGDTGGTLIHNPSILETDPVKMYQASLWYWMTQVGPSSLTATPHSAHECMAGNFGFGCTIMAINGSIECTSLGGGGGTAGVYREKRITDYTSFITVFGGTKVGSDEC